MAQRYTQTQIKIKLDRKDFPSQLHGSVGKAFAPKPKSRISSLKPTTLQDLPSSPGIHGTTRSTAMLTTRVVECHVMSHVCFPTTKQRHPAITSFLAQKHLPTAQDSGLLCPEHAIPVWEDAQKPMCLVSLVSWITCIPSTQITNARSSGQTS